MSRCENCGKEVGRGAVTAYSGANKIILCVQCNDIKLKANSGEPIREWLDRFGYVSTGQILKKKDLKKKEQEDLQGICARCNQQFGWSDLRIVAGTLTNQCYCPTCYATVRMGDYYPTQSYYDGTKGYVGYSNERFQTCVYCGGVAVLIKNPPVCSTCNDIIIQNSPRGSKLSNRYGLANTTIEPINDLWSATTYSGFLSEGLSWPFRCASDEVRLELNKNAHVIWVAVISRSLPGNIITRAVLDYGEGPYVAFVAKVPVGAAIEVGAAYRSGQEIFQWYGNVVENEVQELAGTGRFVAQSATHALDAILKMGGAVEQRGYFLGTPQSQPPPAPLPAPKPGKRAFNFE